MYTYRSTSFEMRSVNTRTLAGESSNKDDTYTTHKHDTYDVDSEEKKYVRAKFIVLLFIKLILFNFGQLVYDLDSMWSAPAAAAAATDKKAI